MYVHVNAAMSVDGKLATRTREQFKISGSADFDRVDKLRAEADAIVVGKGTVLADDPSLIRHNKTHRQRIVGPDSSPPRRVVIDSQCQIPPSANILQNAPPTYIVTSERAATDDKELLKQTGATILNAGSNRVDIAAGVQQLEERGISKILVEGGGEVIYSFFNAGLVDKLTVYVGAMVIGGRDAPTLVDGPGFTDPVPQLQLDTIDQVDDGFVMVWLPE